MRLDGLSELERRLWMEFLYGTHIDRRTGDSERDDPAGAHSWDPERIVRAEVIRDLLVGKPAVDEKQDRQQGARGSPSVFLSGVRITGQLDLRGIDFKPPLLLQQCALDEPLVIAEGISRSIRLYGCHLPGVQGTWLTCTGDLHLRRCQIDGVVDLSGAHISGQLVLSGSTLSNSPGVAVRGDGLVVVGDMFCRDGAVVEGEFSLVAARIGGELRFSKSTLHNPGKVALRAERITVEKDMYCRENFAAEGEVRLPSGQVKGQLNFNDATLRNPGGVALCADQLVVGSHLYCQDGFRAEGGVSLVAARVGGEVRFSTAKLSQENGVALRADRLVVAADMYCREGLEIDGEVSLRGAHVKGVLCFSTAKIRNPKGLAIRANQLTVEGDLSCDEGFDAKGMIDLSDVHVKGELNLSDATLSNPDDVALLAPRLIVDQDMFCRDKFTVYGTVCLIGAHVRGKLSFTSARLIGAKLTDDRLDATGIKQMITRGVVPVEPKPAKDSPAEGRLVKSVRALIRGSGRLILRIWGPDDTEKPARNPRSEGIVSGASGLALIADGLRVDTDMTCDAGFTAMGEIRLKGARIRKNLDFNDAEVNNKDGAALNAEDVQAERMLMPAKCLAGRISLRNGKMIELDDKRGVRPDLIDIAGLAYETLIPPLDPETRLEWLARNDYEPQPYDQLARSYRRLGYDESARKVQLAQERRAREDLPPLRKAWGYLQDVTIGYGYRPMRALALFVLVVLTGVAFFWIFSPEPLAAKHPQFNPFFYTLDVLVPFADFGQRELWNWTTFHEVFKVILSLCGWTLAITAIAGLNRKLTRS